MISLVITWMDALWKKLLFCSPSWSHLTMDFLFENISSCCSLFLNSWIGALSCSWMSSVKPICIPLICTSLIFPSNSALALKMLPNDSLIQCLIFYLRILILFWNWYLCVPLTVGISSHHSFNFSGKSAWSSQKFSKWKGMCRLTPTFSHSNLMGQWFVPADGNIVALSSPPFIIMDFETKKWSSR